MCSLRYALLRGLAPPSPRRGDHPGPDGATRKPYLGMDPGGRGTAAMSTLTSEAEILADLRCVFRESLGVDPVTPIDPATRFFADLGLASIDAVVLGEAIQQRSGRRVPFDQLLADLGGRRPARPEDQRADRVPPASSLTGIPPGYLLF